MKAMQPDSHSDVHVKLYVVVHGPSNERQKCFSSIGSDFP